MQLSAEKKKHLLSIKKEDVTAELIYDLLAHKSHMSNGKFVNEPPKYNTKDTFYLEKGEYFNKERVLTNVGLFFYNKIIVEGELENVLGYINQPIDKKVHGKIEDKLAHALKNDVITPETFITYLDRVQWLGMQFHSIIAPALTLETITPNKKVIAERDKLLKDNKDKLAQGDIKVAVDIEQKLVKMAAEELKNDTGMTVYKSGARADFGNNYKNMHIMKGPVYAQGEWRVIGHNFTEGLEKDDIPMYANAMISGQYPKSVGTQVSGYLFKKVSAGYQAIVADKPGSDCRTKQTITVRLTDSNKNDFIDRYAVVGDKTIILDDNTIDKYVGKDVKLRSVLYCKGGNVKCNKCLGEMFYRLGIENVGLSTTKLATTILNLNMKKFHDATAKLYDIDLNDISI